MIQINFEIIKQKLSDTRVLFPIAGLVIIGAFSAGFLFGSHYPKVLGKQTSRNPLPAVPSQEQDLPLRKYSIQNLEKYDYQISEINLEKVLDKNAAFTSYLFSYRTLGKKMTGQINIPVGPPEKEFPIIVMVRGYVDEEEYRTGVGTSPVAAEFAKAGYVTVAPDFLGFGGSDPSGAGWEERLEKPVNVVELIKSLRQHSQLEYKKTFYRINPNKMGLWAHSNGGQIALTTLEAMGEPIPTALWAPVTAPFPYSVLYYSDEMDDGGAGMRSAVAGFEQQYNVQEYSLTQHIARLRGPIELHQGTADDSVPQKWSDTFVKNINQENDRRKQAQETLTAEIARKESEQKAAIAASASALPSPILAQSPAVSPSALPVLASPIASASASPSAVATGAARPSTIATRSGAVILADTTSPLGSSNLNTTITVEDAFLKPIELNYFVYKGANHFIRPGWEEAVVRDLKFYEQYVGQ